MADAVTIKHAKVSAKADLPDSSLIRPSDWNAAEVLSGGQDGQFCMKDSTKSTGAKWGQALSATTTGMTYTGTSPSPNLGSTPITIADKCIIFLAINAACVLSTGNIYTMTVRRNGSTFTTFSARADNAQYCIGFVTSVENTPGTVTFDFNVSVGSGTFTTFACNATFFTLPIP